MHKVLWERWVGIISLVGNPLEYTDDAVLIYWTPQHLQGLQLCTQE